MSTLITDTTARVGRRKSERFLTWTLLTCTAFGLSCRKLTAEPSKSEASAARPAAPVVAETIYDSGLKEGWQDWGWAPKDVSAGAARLNLTQYGGWILHHDPTSARFGAFMFRVKAPSSLGRFLEVRLAKANGDQSFPAVEIELDRGRSLPQGWTEIYVPWSTLNPSSSEFDRITIRAKTSISVDAIWLDKLVLTRAEPEVAKAAAASSQKKVKLSVMCGAAGRPISEGIYGIAGNVEDLGATSRRWGGNTTTRYNWQIGATNVGKDWFFENGKADHQKFLGESRTQGTTTALTVPTIGWIAKDTSSVGFPISVYGAQKDHDKWKQDAGNGERADGTPVKPRSPTQTSIAAPPELIRRWIEEIVRDDQKNQRRSVQQYILDNEPSLWSSNHRDVHPDPITYDELLDRTIRYGTVIRQADPGATIAGPAEWGWTAYFYSARDAEAGVFLRPDRRAHGDVPLIPWFLKKLREHDQATGIKVLDVLDVHFYPQGDGVWSPKSDPDTAARRLRATRALWDPTYKDESWINDTVRLIPRLKEWVAQNYPGLGVSLGEWNFGAEEHMSGGLAVAEALGRFGAQGLDYAYYWGSLPKGTPAYWAFRAFRNFDGKKGKFLERSVETRMEGEVSLFASRDASGKHMVLIALNLSPTNAAKATFAMPGCAPIASYNRFSYDAQSGTLRDAGPKTSTNLDEELAPYSINVFDLTLK